LALVIVCLNDLDKYRARRKMIKRSMKIWIYIVFLIVASISLYFILRWRKDKPIIHNFRSSNIWKAFVLNSIAASLVIFIAMTTKKNLDKYTGSDVVSVVLTLSTTFVTSMIAFTIMFVIFGFGAGMITTQTESAAEAEAVESDTKETDGSTSLR